MKIIFDSEEEKEEFFRTIIRGDFVCPSDFGMEDKCSGTKSCTECWEKSIPHEIKEPEA